MIKVFISAGHGGKDPGAIGNGLKEKDLNLMIAKACARWLDVEGFLVKLSRETDEDDPVGQEVQEANSFNADYAISFHNNAGGGDGSETYYYANCSISRFIAEHMETASKQLGQNSRGIKPTRDLYFLNKTRMPAVLVETAFIDTNDIEIIDTAEECERFGKAYAYAFINAVGGKPTTPIQPEIQPVDTFTIRAKCHLNIRKGPGVEYDKVGEIDGTYKYTITETAIARDGGTWGRLKSLAGWVNISPIYVIRC